jgi:hypothetical protein
LKAGISFPLNPSIDCPKRALAASSDTNTIVHANKQLRLILTGIILKGIAKAPR